MDTDYVPTDGVAKKKFKVEPEIQTKPPKPTYVMVAPMYGGQPLTTTTAPSSSTVSSEPPTAATTSMTVTLTGPSGTGTGAVAQGGGGKHREEERHPKVSVQQVTQRILSRLMLEGGLSRV